MSQEKRESEVPTGASSLMDLFAPPPASELEETTENDTGVRSGTNDGVTAIHTTSNDVSESTAVDETMESITSTTTGGPQHVISAQSLASQAANRALLATTMARQGRADDASNAAALPTPPPPPPEKSQRPPLRPSLVMKRQSTAKRSNVSSNMNEQSALLQQQEWWLKQSPASLPTPKTGRASYNGSINIPDFPMVYNALSDTNNTGNNRKSSLSEDQPLLAIHEEQELSSFRQKHFQASTFIGSFMFLLYHIVFCLAMGSTITRSDGSPSILGPMAKMTAVGVIFASPLFIFRAGHDIPALYATADLFLAPFLANLATVCDDVLTKDGSSDDDVFFATFCVMSGIGMILSATLLVLASKFKLANLGTYLPYSVLCGFFSAVGIMLWALAFTVDTNQKWQDVLFHGSFQTKQSALLHHLPSLVVGISMKWLGPKHPFYVSVLVIGTMLTFYTVMWATGTSLAQAQEDEWFWSRQDLVYTSRTVHIGFDNWAPPAPFGVLNSLFLGKVHWGAVYKGMPTICALSFLYLLRCSLHGTALKKNITNLVRFEKVRDGPPARLRLRTLSNGIKNSFKIKKKTHVRNFSEALDIEQVVATTNNGDAQKPNDNVKTVRAKHTKLSLQNILMEYAYSQYLVAIVGGFCVLPSIAIAPTMYTIGAEGVAPQYGSVILLLVFYLTNFELVGFIPKAAFSSLLVLAAIDMIVTWFVKSFHKTRDKTEWLVVPLIVVFAFVVGLLNAVFLGVAISTFIFVGSFFQTGVVKFAATGLTIRSTIERSIKSGNWLDKNGDLIQVLVLQNYLFFGNASSILSYICTMFEEPDRSEAEKLDFPLPPTPKVLILDLTLITGMDTSTVDVLSDIKTMCASHGCKIFLCGLSSRFRSILALGGVKPETGERSKRTLRMFPDLDSALGKAEDMLIRNVERHEMQERPRLLSEGDNGFRYALRQIDEQHGKDFAFGLVALHKYTTPIELEPGKALFRSDGELLPDRQRGLFFIESGLMKIERDPTQTMTRGNVNSLKRRSSRNDLTQLNARTGSIGRQVAALKAGAHEITTQNMRLARIGPGWVVGAIEGVTGWENPGRHVAVTHCRLHHLPYSVIEKIEKENPVLILNLYKMLAHLMARRQEITIEQLATLHSIMTSRALTKPVSRATQGAIANVQNSLH